MYISAAAPPFYPHARYDAAIITLDYYRSSCGGERLRVSDVSVRRAQMQFRVESALGDKETVSAAGSKL